MAQSADSVYGAHWVASLRIANPPPSLLARYTNKEKDFFYDYANFVIRIVQDGAVTERISEILATENIRLDRALDIRVMVFPARTFRGQGNRTLHGSYSSDAAQISLYPVRVPKEWIRLNENSVFRETFHTLPDRKRRLLNEISENTIGTLLHEIFHTKLGPRGMPRHVEEAIVRKMEEQHMKGCTETISHAVERSLRES